MTKRFVIFSALLALGCDGTGSQQPGVNCTDEARPGISVTAFDEITGDALKIAGTVTATDGSFSQSVANQPPGEPSFYLAYERAGTYDVAIKIPGYRELTISKVAVKRDACHVSTVPLAARLFK